jgi:hypothetical protein
MNTGQTILTCLAIVLLGTNVLDVNRTFLQHGAVLQQTEIGLFGISLATSLLEEAQGKAFDEESMQGLLTSTTQCTPANSLGPGSSESRAVYDDFDDYNWMTGGPTNDNTVVRADTIKVQDVDTFIRWSKVCYVDTTSPNTYRAYPTWNKKLTVYVKGKSSSDTLKLSYIFSYWSFR